MRILIKISAFIILALMLLGFGFFLFINIKGPLTSEKNIVIERGVRSAEIGRRLEETGIIYTGVVFRPTVFLLGEKGKLKAGEYSFKPKISLKQVIERMVAGDVVVRAITVPEGLSVFQIIAMVKKDINLIGDITTQPKEGELLPETYNFSYGYTREEMVKRMMEERRKLVEILWQSRRQDLPFKDINEAITLASIVEKETGVKAERQRVAAVYINRLRKGMALQADPTVIYALTKGEKEMERELLSKDLQVDSPYNTYKYPGLPPTPIANPGRESIMAVFSPLETKELYFVADGNGGHNFSETLEQHNKNVASYRKMNTARKQAPH